MHQTFVHQQVQFVVLRRRLLLLLLLLLRGNRHRGCDLLRRCRRLLLLAVGRFVPPEKVQPTLFATGLDRSVRSRSGVATARPVLVFVLVVVVMVLRRGLVTVRRRLGRSEHREEVMAGGIL